jgi:hypothetical protein
VEYITFKPSVTAFLNLQGYQYDYLANVFLSSNSVQFPSLTGVSTFTSNRVVSSFCPPFTGYNLPTRYINATDNNNVQITISPLILTGTGLIDVILFNKAGYTKLSDKNTLLLRVSL